MQGRFRHFGSNYSLWITDPGYEHKYLDKPVGRYKIGESFLTVSLSEPYDDGNCHKLIAAIIERSEVRT